MISERGYEVTTLREIAKDAHVSVELLYRYFPSKQAVVIALYEELSRDFSGQAAAMKPGKWRDRFLLRSRRVCALSKRVVRRYARSSPSTLRVPPIRRFVIAFDELIREGLFGSPAAA